MFGLRLLIVLLTIVSASSSQTQPLIIAAAADLGPAFKEICAEFEKQSGTKVEVILGSSGNFFAQIQNGAPYDLFFSADKDYAQRLQNTGLADNFTIYAIGNIVLWTRKDSQLELSRGMNILLDDSVKKIAIANPAHAPYGRAAISALEYFHLADKIRAKLVLGENIAQATQFVQTGNADVAITALSLALSPALQDGKRGEIPRDAYPALEQGAVVLRSAKNRTAALAFLEYLRSPSAQETMRKYGFHSAEEKP